MKEKIREILWNFVAGEVTDSEAVQQVLDLFAVSSLVCPKCKSDAIAEYPDYKECRICGKVW